MARVSEARMDQSSSSRITNPTPHWLDLLQNSLELLNVE